ncbi:phospholipid/cholesterol/gamma-HCH transport system substrate-binding protein [Allopseudospirillum japonicum]|uniref:Phospholipid/cholesterol/gamma-HCH transport system substrate-binding protein n=1 Tax=Allopseudospirillum japonicum TaxID=64971 RepID=A0A1H6S8W7_9GAMM|nr:MlaD family protein [Allopseudospirillum japonicum]SEI61217.1 phospholipid/cholesterol/gamma-HCH transport system substrate-binding protein [Allopseudospirillum japonicum]
MQARVNYTLVGAFVLAGITLLSAILWWLLYDRQQIPMLPYDTYMYESVSGLNPKAPVKYKGVQVGYVERISLDKTKFDRVHLRLHIEKDVTLTEDTSATLATQGITGLAYVELSGGSHFSPALMSSDKQVAEIPSRPSKLMEINHALSSLFAQFALLSERLDTLALQMSDLLKESNRQEFARILQNTQALLTELRGLTQDTRQFTNQELRVQLDTLLTSVTQLAESSRHELAQTRQNLTQALTAIQADTQQLAATWTKTGQSAQGVSRDVSQSLAQITPLVQQLQNLVKSLEARPNQVVFGKPRPALGPGE